MWWIKLAETFESLTGSRVVSSTFLSTVKLLPNETIVHIHSKVILERGKGEIESPSFRRTQFSLYCRGLRITCSLDIKSNFQFEGERLPGYPEFIEGVCDASQELTNLARVQSSQASAMLKETFELVRELELGDLAVSKVVCEFSSNTSGGSTELVLKWNNLPYWLIDYNGETLEYFLNNSIRKQFTRSPFRVREEASFPINDKVAQALANPKEADLDEIKALISLLKI